MRIACIHVPQFALQCATRLDPSLRGAAIAVVSGVEPGRERSGVLHAPVVLACSRAAWSLGVRLGMTATAVRSLATDVSIVTTNPVAERETVRAIADALLATTATVDVGGRVGAGGAHLAMYAEVPAKTRGTSFGDRLVELLAELGIAVRIGIADDRFTAWVAAAYGVHGAEGHEHHDGAVVNVPRGGSAAFLAPRPLSLLAIPREVQHMLESLGVRTLGEFAALPAPSVARPLEADYQALARGDSGALLRPYHPEAPVREEIVVSAGTVLELPGSLSVPAAIAQLSRRIAMRLAGRGRGAARLDVAMIPADAEVRELPITIDGAITDAEELAHVLAPVLETAAADLPKTVSHGGWHLRVIVTGEVVLGGETVEIFAEGSSPFAIAANSNANSTHSTNSTSSNHSNIASSAHLTAALPRARRSDIASSAASSAFAAASAKPSTPAANAGNATSAAGSRMKTSAVANDSQTHDDDAIHPLSVVLASSGSLFALASPMGGGVGSTDRRDVHRRTRRGKQRRTRPTAQVQPRLFDRVSQK